MLLLQLTEGSEDDQNFLAIKYLLINVYELLARVCVSSNFKNDLTTLCLCVSLSSLSKPQEKERERELGF